MNKDLPNKSQLWSSSFKLNNSSGSSGLSKMWIGIIVGGCVLLIIIIIFIFYKYKKRGTSQSLNNNQHQDSSYTNKSPVNNQQYQDNSSINNQDNSPVNN
jgi:hypothetical protein